MPYKGETESRGNATTYSACNNELVAKLGLEKGTRAFRPVSLRPGEEVGQDAARWWKVPSGSQCSPVKMGKTCSVPRSVHRPAPAQHDYEGPLG